MVVLSILEDVIYYEKFQYYSQWRVPNQEYNYMTNLQSNSSEFYSVYMKR